MITNKQAARLLFKAALRVAAKQQGGVGGVSSKSTSISEVHIKNKDGSISSVNYNFYLNEVKKHNE